MRAALRNARAPRSGCKSTFEKNLKLRKLPGEVSNATSRAKEITKANQKSEVSKLSTDMVKVENRN
jgi:hypothetical protein